LSVLDKDLDLLSEVSLGDSELYGYSSLHVYRYTIVNMLRCSLTDKGAGHCLHWHARFQHVVADEPAGREFQLAHGWKHITSLLVGADGINSRVWSHITDTVPNYTGVLALTAVLDGTPSLPKNGRPRRLPSMINCSQGGFVISPQDKGLVARRSAFGTSVNFHILEGRDGKELSRDERSLLEILRRDTDEWPEYVQEMMNLASPKDITFW
jgi:2-polyprenyl-6-methoxyphenol hydroxylase-like FAD-dependent oxidoreductase